MVLPGVIHKTEEGELPKAKVLVEEERIQTFEKWPKTCPIIAKKFARTGLYFTGVKDRVRCAFCDVSLENWTSEDNPVIEHHEHSLLCPYMMGYHAAMKDRMENEIIKGESDPSQDEFHHVERKLSVGDLTKSPPTNLKTTISGICVPSDSIEGSQRSHPRYSPRNLTPQGGSDAEYSLLSTEPPYFGNFSGRVDFNKVSPSESDKDDEFDESTDVVDEDTRHDADTTPVGSQDVLVNDLRKTTRYGMTVSAENDTCSIFENDFQPSGNTKRTEGSPVTVDWDSTVSASFTCGKETDDNRSESKAQNTPGSDWKISDITLVQQETTGNSSESRGHVFAADCEQLDREQQRRLQLKIGREMRPVYPRYEHIRERLLSFQTWTSPFWPILLVAAGFFYTGHFDCTMCFHCGSSRSRWKQDDDPEYEHRVLAPGCRFIRNA